MVQLAELLRIPTVEEAESTLLGLLDTLGFPTTSWQAKSWPRTTVKTVATLYVDVKTSVQAIGSGGILDYSTAKWLTLKADGDYDNERYPAVSTEGLATLTAQVGSGGDTYSVGQLWAQDASGKLFNNTTGGTLSAATTVPTTLEVAWKAEQPGAAYNIPNGTLTLLAVDLPGISIDNPAQPSTGTWITTSGADEETDESLRERCRTKWATLGPGGSAQAYANWARTGAPTVTRVRVDDLAPFGAGTVAVYLANASGAASAQEVIDANVYVQARRALTANVSVLPATARAVGVIATVYVKSDYAASAPGEATANITALSQTIDIGEDVYLSEITTALSAPSGVRNVVVVAPVGDSVVAANEVAVIGLTLTVVSV